MTELSAELREMAKAAGFVDCYEVLDMPDSSLLLELFLAAFARLVAEDCANPWPAGHLVLVPEKCSAYAFGEGIRAMQDAIKAKYAPRD